MVGRNLQLEFAAKDSSVSTADRWQSSCFSLAVLTLAFKLKVVRYLLISGVGKREKNPPKPRAMGNRVSLLKSYLSEKDMHKN